MIETNDNTVSQNIETNEAPKPKKIFDPTAALVGHYKNITEALESTKQYSYCPNPEGKVFLSRRLPNVAKFVLRANQVKGVDLIEESLKITLGEDTLTLKLVDLNLEQKKKVIKFLKDYHNSSENNTVVSPKMSQNGFMYEELNIEQPTSFTLVSKVETMDVEEIEEGFILETPKIPFKIFLQILTFFRDISDFMEENEAMTQIWWDIQKQEYFVECPEQTTSKVHVTYKNNKELETNQLRYRKVMDFHSHNTMDAFFSGTDDADEKLRTQFFGVMGRVKNDSPATKFRYCVEGIHKEVSMFDIFESPKFKITIFDKETELEVTSSNLGLAAMARVDYPEEWVETVKRGKIERVQKTVVTQPFMTKPDTDEEIEEIFKSEGSSEQRSIFDTDFSNPNPTRIAQPFEWGKEHNNNQRVSILHSSHLKGDYYEDDYYLADDEPLDDNEIKEAISCVENMNDLEVKMFLTTLLEDGYEDKFVEVLKEFGYIVRLQR